MRNDLMQFSHSVAMAASVHEAEQALCVLTENLIGVKLFTLMTFDRGRGVASRSFSNMPDQYPVSGTKPVSDNAWTTHVLDRRQTFVANTIEEIAQVFDDFELIRSLGCQSVINVPIVVGGDVLGTINCLHAKQFYSAGKVAASEALKLPGAVCLLMQKLASQKEALNG